MFPVIPAIVRSALRSVVGPVLLATGVWCAAGVVALPSTDLTSSRILVFAPWWLLALVFAATWLVPACRREPALATPALLSVLPWLPLPLPAIALLWSGRLAWVPVGLCLVAVLRAGWTARSNTTQKESDRVPRSGIVAAAALTAIALSGTAWALAPRLPGGDEPHYLIITQSLIEDGDLQIENNHQARDYARYVRGTLLPDFLQRGRNEVIYSIHAPGLPVLVTPLFAAFGYRGAQATVVLCAVLSGGLIWASGWLATRSKSAAWFAWAAVASSVTFLVQGVSIFPDGPAAAVIAASTVVLLRLERRAPVGRGTLIGLSAALAALPFLHTRLATVSAGVGGAVLWYLAIEADRTVSDRRARILAFLVLPILGIVAWLGYFQILYGTPNPAIAYGKYPETRAAYVPGGVLGLLFDQDFGLLAFAPVLGAALVGWLRRDSAVAMGRPLLIAMILYLAAVGTYWMWWAGLPATPARFATAILPALAPGLAVAWHRSARTGRTVLAALASATMAITAVTLTVDRGALAWNTYDANPPWLDWLGTSVNLARGLPSFFWNLNPGVASSEWPFGWHVLVVAAVLSAMGIGLRALGRSGGGVPEARAVWAVAVGFMLCVQAGWWVTAAPPLRPIGAQLRALRAMSHGRPARFVAAGSLIARPAQLAEMRLDVPRVNVTQASGIAWEPLADIPAGDYQLTMVERRPVGGVLSVAFGSEARTPQSFTLERQTEPTVALTLPVGASSLSFAADPVLAAVAQRLSLRAVRLDGTRRPAGE